MTFSDVLTYESEFGVTSIGVRTNVLLDSVAESMSTDEDEVASSVLFEC